MFEAVKYGHVKVVKELLYHNANIEAIDTYGKTVFDISLF
jgi:hypothetical protein